MQNLIRRLEPETIKRIDSAINDEVEQRVADMPIRIKSENFDIGEFIIETDLSGGELAILINEEHLIEAILERYEVEHVSNLAMAAGY